jgi:DNA polymerase III alpha subunit (gram-positive type)
MGKLFRFDFSSVRHSPEAYVLSPQTLVSHFPRRKFLIIDIEATGLDVERDEVTEIAVQQVNVDLSFGDAWRSYIRINGEIPPAISRLTSITKEMTDQGIHIAEALASLITRFQDHIWVAQCGYEYDFPFLERVYHSLGLPSVGIDTLDPKILYALLYPEVADTFSTDFLSRYYGIDRSRFARHTAAGDVALIAEIFTCMGREATKANIEHLEVASSLEIRKFLPAPLV